VPHLIAEFQALARGHVGVSDLQQALLDARATSILLHLLHLTLTAAQAEQSPPGEEPVRQAEQFLRSEFQSLRSLREVAGHVGLSSNHLRHLFKKNRGISMVAYLNQVRMERARSLLTQSRLPLKQVARLCGFADEYYFSAVFRRHNHIAPGQYRQRK
jgi:transcriptional regulator GlxA family with amidase domain